jgi:hypothetical protein
LSLELRSREGNRHALGAKVEVLAGGLRQFREVQSGFGYGSQAPPIAYFGLGQAAVVDSLRVFWPDGWLSLFTGLVVDQHMVLEAPQVTAIETGGLQPRRFGLYANYPNPFNGGTLIPFDVPQAEAGKVQLDIFNISG